MVIIYIHSCEYEDSYIYPVSPRVSQGSSVSIVTRLQAWWRGG